MLPRRLLSAALVFAVLASVGCADQTVILASINVTDSGAPPPLPTRCVDSTSCPTGYYCSLPACGAPTGTCVLPPSVCDATEAPVCGCDNITYFNDCLRGANLIAASTPNPCQETGVPCGDPPGPSCPDGTLCAELGGFPHGPCGHIPGTCWFLPSSCATVTPSDYWDSCSPTGGECLDTCSAIRAGGGYHRSQTCPP